MKIPLSKGKLLGAERDIANFIIKGKNLHLTITAIVDNGSPYTLVAESDLKRTRIHYTQLSAVQKVYLGPIALNLIDLGDCTLIFKDTENNIIKLSQKVYGGILTQRNIQLIQTLPSILGRDFLTKYNFGIKRDEEGNPFLQT